MITRQFTVSLNYPTLGDDTLGLYSGKAKAQTVVNKVMIKRNLKYLQRGSKEETNILEKV